ncbi:PREDICTED: probable membrane-associated kinase regulator 2 [Lupinus angustifolius]|uniref:probable membrane-associated kinase regulator 2 n=1 Tax=Lupinus angustifolius TaxID=3871 RepID=UPI00092FCE4F|nr:PREDICTED: probable membrane-associated kinase regulator 2 [Lupinus angustifolius]
MEAFTLLKYWRGAAGLRLLSSSTTTTILTAADEHSDAGDDGPFFDIEFTLPDDTENGKHNHHIEEDEESECERELKLMQMENPNISLSPSHHNLFFERKLLHVVEPSSSEPNPKPHQFNSSSKFRVFMSALKKSKSSSSSSSSSNSPSDSLPTESSQKNKDSFNNKKESSPEEKQRFSKEAMQKYLKMVKPLYVKVSRRYMDKLNHSGNLNEKGTPLVERTQKKHEAVKEDNRSSNSTNNKSQKVTEGLRVVCKHLGKSRSASSAAVAAAPPLLSSKRRDDSLLQQQDGIQGAILHCKTSFNASIECEIPPKLPRCVSEPLHEK